MHTTELLVANVALLRQGSVLLEQVDDRLYCRIAPPLLTSTVGGHFRHCLDAYRCFARGLDSGLIDYDVRDRGSLIETDRGAARAAIERMIARLQAGDLADAVGELQARQDGAGWATTSVERELQFLLSHTTHHYALIALMLRLEGVAPAAESGVAPATLAYQRKERAACAR